MVRGDFSVPRRLLLEVDSTKPQQTFFWFDRFRPARFTSPVRPRYACVIAISYGKADRYG